MIKKIILWVCNLFCPYRKMIGRGVFTNNGIGYIPPTIGEIKIEMMPFPPKPPKEEIGPDCSITRKELTADEINERYPIIPKEPELDKYIRLDHNMSAIRRWMDEKEECEIIDHMLEWDREALVRLNEYISKALTSAKEQ